MVLSSLLAQLLLQYKYGCLYCVDSAQKLREAIAIPQQDTSRFCPGFPFATITLYSNTNTLTLLSGYTQLPLCVLKIYSRACPFYPKVPPMLFFHFDTFKQSLAYALLLAKLSCAETTPVFKFCPRINFRLAFSEFLHVKRYIIGICRRVMSAFTAEIWLYFVALYFPL